MTDTHQPRLRDVPLTSEDLAICDMVLDELCAEFQLANGGSVVDHLASIIIELYRQGVREPEQLKLLAGATREKGD
ncbi:hypothetical protein N2599_20785 (plasmid) [Rhizobium sullae]|uniref:Uncharacterized protein n=1 Tax=Rhizobium sullae TaxID=50338 RepID=A0A2N0DF57_RHISU|nr:hypothetical protein [Rhizobium sullae]PKA44717.1 hypothetical protein CWR43_02375 [Rhizobium sullae]UWU17772.1 hypothetical protein N2599_20785 [Rhizobium sullae]